MAKKITIDIEVNGKMQKATVSAKKLQKALDGVDNSTEKATKSGDRYQRGLKGVGQQSANNTKNNAKMIQGMGGLVGVYASLAAQLFAVSAAFQFLKRAGDLQVLQSGQTAYASATGVALKGLTNDLVEATEAQITFRDAAQAAAIGTASGLSRDQLTKLGTAAKDVSIVLGRDVTDSFNRLVRGVTKAEPELLDELGIVLRLKDATEKYAASLGKSANDLTAFERSQAVANDVLSQTEQKYSKILAVTGSSVNQFNQLGKAFDDVVMKVQNAAAVIAGPFSKVLTETPSLAIASLGLLLKGPLAAMGINFGELAKGARKSAAESQAYYETVSAEAKKATLDQEKLKTAFKNTVASIPKTNVQASPVLQRAQAGVMTKRDQANLSKALQAAEKNYNKHGIVVKGIFKGMSIQMVRDMTFAFEQVNLAEQKKLSKTKVYATRAVAFYAGVAASVKSMGAAVATAGTKLLSFLGYLGIAVTLYQLVKDVVGFGNENLSASEQLYQKNRDSLAELNEELKTFAEVQRILAEGTMSMESFSNIGSAIGQRNLKQAAEDYKLYLSAQRQDLANQKANQARKAVYEKNQGVMLGKEGHRVYSKSERERIEEVEAANPVKALTKYEKNAQEFFNNMIKSLDAVEKETGVTQAAFTEFRRVLEEGGTEEEFNKARDSAIGMANAIKEGSRIAEDARTSVQSFITSFAPLNSAETSLQKIDDRLKNIATQAKGASFQQMGPVFEDVEDEFGNIIQKQKMEIDPLTGALEPVMQMITMKGLPADHPLMVEKRLLEQQRPIIDTINKSKHQGQIDSLKFQQKLATSVKGQDAAQRALQQLENKSLTLENQKAIKEEERRILMEDITKLQKGELTPAQQRRVELLDEEITLLGLQNEEIEYKKTLEEKILETKRNQIKLQDTQSIIGAEKLALEISQKAFEIDKQRLEIQSQLRKSRMDENIADRTANNPFADNEGIQARANLDLAKQELNIRLPFIKKEYDNKVAMIGLEYDLLDAKRQQTANEMTLLAARLREESEQDPSKLAQAARAEQLATDLMAASYDDAEKAALNLAKSTKEASEYGLAKAVRDAERAVEALKPMNQVLMSAGKAFTSSLNDAFNVIFDYAAGQVKDLNEALKEVGRGLIQTIQEAVTQQFIVNPILDMFGLRDDPAAAITAAHTSGAQAVGTAITTGASTMQTSIQTALNSAQVKVCCCNEETPGAPIPSELKRIQGLGSFENVLKDEGFTQGQISAARFDPSVGDTFLQSSDSFGGDILDDMGGEGQGGFFSSITAMFSNLFGEGGRITGMLGNLFGGDGILSGMFNGLFGDGGALSGLFSSLLGGLGSLFGGAGAGIMSLFGFKNGGIMDNGKKVQGYAAGGIAKGPKSGHMAMLHGKEAVVPLPKGNAIPVDMKGSGGVNTNNVSVNVDMGSGGGGAGRSTVTPGQGSDLGAAVAQAVQKELQNQKRAGGILNPYGTS